MELVNKALYSYDTDGKNYRNTKNRNLLFVAQNSIRNWRNRRYGAQSRNQHI
jgi:hypothetical protein